MVWRGALEGQRDYRGLRSLLEELIAPGTERHQHSAGSAERIRVHAAGEEVSSQPSEDRVAFTARVCSGLSDSQAGGREGVGSECEQH